MKKIISIIFAATCLLGFCSCESKEERAARIIANQEENNDSNNYNEDNENNEEFSLKDFIYNNYKEETLTIALDKYTRNPAQYLVVSKIPSEDLKKYFTNIYVDSNCDFLIFVKEDLYISEEFSNNWEVLPTPACSAICFYFLNSNEYGETWVSVANLNENNFMFEDKLGYATVSNCGFKQCESKNYWKISYEQAVEIGARTSNKGKNYSFN